MFGKKSPLASEAEAVEKAAENFTATSQLSIEQRQLAKDLAKETLDKALGGRGRSHKDSVKLIQAQLETAFLHQMVNPDSQAGQVLSNPDMHDSLTEALARNIQKTRMNGGPLDLSRQDVASLQTGPRDFQKQIGSYAAFQVGKANVDQIVPQFPDQDLNEIGMSQNALRRALTERTWLSGKRDGVESAGDRLRGNRALENFELADRNISALDREMRLTDQTKNERMLDVQSALISYAQSYDPGTRRFGSAQGLNLDNARRKLDAQETAFREAAEAYVHERNDFYQPRIEAALRAHLGDQFSDSQIKAAARALTDSVVRDQDPVLQSWPTNEKDAQARVKELTDHAAKGLAAGKTYTKPDGTSLTAGANPEADRVADLVYAARGATARGELGDVSFDIMGRSEDTTNRLIEDAVTQQQALDLQNAPLVRAQVAYDPPAVLQPTAFTISVNENKSAQQASETYTMRAGAGEALGSKGETLAFAKPQFVTTQYTDLKQQQDTLQNRITEIESTSASFKEWTDLNRQIDALPIDLQRAQDELKKTENSLAQVELGNDEAKKQLWREEQKIDKAKVDALLVKGQQLPQLQQRVAALGQHPDVVEHAAKVADIAKVDEKIAPMVSAAAAAAPLYNEVQAMQDPALGGDRAMLTRAVASYQVDQLLGTGVIAEEKVAQTADNRLMGVSVQVDGVQIAGKHEGKDCYLQARYDDPNIQKGLADLETVDYITGQIDRHHGNIFVDPSNGKVTGIDNDLAFPERRREVMLRDGALSEKAVAGLPKQMAQDTADKVLALTPEKLEAELKKLANPDGSTGKLSEAEVRGAVQRLQELQAAIKDPNSGVKLVKEFNRETYEAAIKQQKESLVAEKKAKDIEVATDTNRPDFGDIDNPSDLNKVSKSSYLGAVVLQERTYELKNGQVEEGVEFGLRDPDKAGNKAQVNPEFAAFKRAEQNAKQALAGSPELIENQAVRREVTSAQKELGDMRAKLDEYQKRLDQLESPSAAEKAKALLTHGGVDNTREFFMEKKTGMLQQMKAKQEQLDGALNKAVEPLKMDLYNAAHEKPAVAQQAMPIANQAPVPAVQAAQNPVLVAGDQDNQPRPGSVADSLRSSRPKVAAGDSLSASQELDGKNKSVGQVSKLKEKHEQAIKEQTAAVSGPNKKPPSPKIGTP